MSLIYRSSLLFSQPSHYTISHMEVEDALYEHKKKLHINHRSTSRDNNYKTQRLSARQVKTIENLSQRTRTYSLNTILKTYHKAINDQEIVNSKKNSPSKQTPRNNKFFQTIDSFQVEAPFICPQKLKLFNAGINYRSKQRARGAGVKKVNMEDLKTYFDRCPQEEVDFLQLKKCQAIKKNCAIQQPITMRTTTNSFKSNRVQSCRNFGK